MTLSELRAAAAGGQLFLMYQPKVDLSSGEVNGVEALARWNHVKRGPIEPTQFVSEVERGGLIDWFSEWAIRSAIKQSAAWRAEGIHMGMAVNISALNLEHVDFPDLVSRICSEENVERDTLTLELTETATQDTTRLMDTTIRFRLKNIGISLDDFGTGYGSLVQLRSLPFTELKIDRSFVSDLLHSKDSRAIIRALIQMSHDIGLSVTAEGVEDYDTLAALTLLGCDRAQGYYIAHAMPGEQLPLWMRKWQRRQDAGGNEKFLPVHHADDECANHTNDKQRRRI
ncbi:MAG TPA: EAL domain-containing protein [Sphingomicrobium sp.]|nr:EAL domain-containing protein [Sphingomicrobium sp.]